MDQLVQLQAQSRQARVLATYVVNGEPVSVAIAPNATLLEILREDLDRKSVV